MEQCGVVGESGEGRVPDSGEAREAVVEGREERVKVEHGEPDGPWADEQQPEPRLPPSAPPGGVNVHACPYLVLHDRRYSLRPLSRRPHGWPASRCKPAPAAVSSSSPRWLR